MSMKEIASLLNVSQSSVSAWVRDIELTSVQRRAHALRNPALNPNFNGSKTLARRALAERLEYQAEGRAIAQRRDPEFAAACMLFWAEGSRERNAVKFTNSDPEMMAFSCASCVATSPCPTTWSPCGATSSRTKREAGSVSSNSGSTRSSFRGAR